MSGPRAKRESVGQRSLAYRAVEYLLDRHRYTLEGDDAAFLIAIGARLAGGTPIGESEIARISQIRGQLARRHHQGRA